MRKLIVNADDFGWSSEVNRGVLECFEGGIVSSATMLVNAPGFDEAAELARGRDLPVGLHLNLTLGRPVAPVSSVAALLGGDGGFVGFRVLVRRILLGQLSALELETEIRAQLTKFRQAGLAPTHLDSHKHVHCLAAVLDAVLKVAPEFGLRKTRLPLETASAVDDKLHFGHVSWRSAWKRDIIRWLCRRRRRVLAEAGFISPDHFWGFNLMDAVVAGPLKTLLAALPEGSNEIMCHPGYESPESWAETFLKREIELENYKNSDLKDILRDNGIQLISFGDL